MKKFIFLLFVPFVSFAQTDSLKLEDKLAGKVGIEVQPSIDPTEPLYLIDGKIVDKTVAEELNPNEIESINVLKGEKSIEKYGEAGKNGAVEIHLKEKKEEVSISEKLENMIPVCGLMGIEIPEIPKIDSIIVPEKKFPGTVCQASVRNVQNPLYLIDGEEILDISVVPISFIEENIKSIKVLKGKEAIYKYGEKGNYGVIEIETNDGNGITEYDLTVLESGYESFLAMQPSVGTYSLNYLENKNRQYVSVWNQRVTSGNPEIYEMPIDYDAKNYYGLEFEHKLYMFFKFMEKKHSISMM